MTRQNGLGFLNFSKPLWISSLRALFPGIALLALLLSSPVIFVGYFQLTQAQGEIPQKVPCQILEASYREKHYAPSPFRDIRHYEWNICFSFLLEKQRHSGCHYEYYYPKFALLPASEVEKEAQSVVAAYPPGSLHFCYVNPHEPESASLTLGDRKKLVDEGYMGLVFGMGLFLFLMGWFWLLVFYVSRKPKRDA